MKVFKFGGASVSSAAGVRNLCRIAADQCGPLFIVVSAMGKTTTALEAVTSRFVAGDNGGALALFAGCESYHSAISRDLSGSIPAELEGLFGELKNLLDAGQGDCAEYDLWYDRIVSYGEMFSTTIVAGYLRSQGMDPTFVDMRQVLVTDDWHREANVDLHESERRLRNIVGGEGLYIGQGFIGGTAAGEPTTLGREGSDYSAALAGYMLDAESVTIWKDVDGVRNADPKFFDDTVRIPELTYLDAVELAYSGAQVIHSKTIKPLQNKNIPLYVKPFSAPEREGSVIKNRMDGDIGVPVLILRRDQVLISIRPNDFSFVLEDRFASIFSLLEQYRIKINLIQSSAVNLSLGIDDSRHLKEAVDRLIAEGYRVAYNDGVELLTIRGYTEELFKKYVYVSDVLLSQRTRRTVRIIRRKGDGAVESVS